MNHKKFEVFRTPSWCYESFFKNFMDFKTKHKYNLIITNPPFSLAEQFIKKATTHLKKDGLIIVLLRLGFLGSRKREQLFSDYNLYSVVVMTRRPTWEIDGKDKNNTDNSDYGWFIFKLKSKNVQPKLEFCRN